MSDISKIQLPNKNVYDIKDEISRDKISKLENKIDVNINDKSLVLNIDDNKIRLIFNSDKTINWEYIALVNVSTINSINIVHGESFTISCEGSGGKKPYQFAVKVKHSTASDYTWIKGYGDERTVEWEPYKTGTYTVCISVKDSMDNIADKLIEINVTGGDNDMTNDNNYFMDEDFVNEKAVIY